MDWSAALPDSPHFAFVFQAQLEWTSKRADRVEKLYSEQLETQLSRKTEQEKELSERESKILDLR